MRRRTSRSPSRSLVGHGELAVGVERACCSLPGSPVVLAARRSGLPLPGRLPSITSVIRNVTEVNPSEPIWRPVQTVWAAQDDDHADQGNQPQRGQQQVVAQHGAVTGSE